MYLVQGGKYQRSTLRGLTTTRHAWFLYTLKLIWRCGGCAAHNHTLQEVGGDNKYLVQVAYDKLDVQYVYWDTYS